MNKYLPALFLCFVIPLYGTDENIDDKEQNKRKISEITPAQTLADVDQPEQKKTRKQERSSTLPSEDVERSKPVKMTNPCIDSVFQYGFRESSILSDFLNAVLGFTGNNCIENIEYLPKDMSPSDPISSFAYHFTVDVRCRTKNNQHFLIEMQNDFRDDYHLKSLIEHSRMLSRLDIDQTLEDQNLRKEKNKKDIKKFWKNIEGLYTIVITNKCFPHNKTKNHYAGESIMEPFLVNNYELRHTQQLERRYGDIPNQIVLLMLDNLNKKPEELSSAVERWSYLFKDPSLSSGVTKISEIKEIIDPDLIAGGNHAIKAFIERVNIDNLPQEVRERYIRSLAYFNDTILDIRDKALEKGKAEGKQIGKEQEKKETAVKMLKMDMDIKIISQITELSEEDIKSLNTTEKN